jgi:hypothetical protein
VNDVFPFLVGCPRSGTTLLRAMLDSHSQLAIPGESHFIVEMAGRRERYEAADGPVAEAFVEDLVESGVLALWQLPEAALRRALGVAAPRSLASAIRVLFATYAAQQGKRRYGDKTPGYVRELPVLAGLFEEARFVHLLRDGRDVALALMEVEWARKQAPRGIETMAEFWRVNVEMGRAAGRHLPADRYLEVRYERLVADPEGSLRQVCAFLDLAYEPQMLKYFERFDTISESLRSPSAHRHLALPPTSGLRDWRREMKPRDVALFDRVAGDALARAGYERHSE